MNDIDVNINIVNESNDGKKVSDLTDIGEEDLGLDNNSIHMHLPDKSDEVDLHFTRMVTNLDYKITTIEQNQSTINQQLRLDIIKLRQDLESGD